MSRQKAAESEYNGGWFEVEAYRFIAYLKGLPSVSTEKTGRWKFVQYDFDPRIGNWHCSECRNIIIQGVEKKGIHKEVIYKFCPWCGAKMEVEE